jgi:hypothetical protein
VPGYHKLYKIIDCRTREVLISRLLSDSHTAAETLARKMLPDVHVVASLLRPKADEVPVTKKKRTKKR